MPTRDVVAVKPSSNDFDAGSALGASMLAGWIFDADSVSGLTVTDLTGAHTITAEPGTTFPTPDAIHGQCVLPAVGGLQADPDAAFDGLADYSVVVGIRIDEDLASYDTTLFQLVNTSGSQDAIRLEWRSSEQVRAVLEDSDSGANPSVNKAIEDNAGEWITVAAVVDAQNDIASVYIIVDGEATQVGSIDPSGIAGSVLSDLLLLFGADGANPMVGLGEFAYVLTDALTQAEVEALHVNPYSWEAAAAPTLSIASVNPASPKAREQVVITVADPDGAVVLDLDGQVLTIDSVAGNVLTVNSWPALENFSGALEYGETYSLTASDESSSASQDVITQVDDGFIAQDIANLSSGGDDDIHDDDTGIANGMQRLEEVTQGALTVDPSGAVVVTVAPATLRYWINDLISWVGPAVETFSEVSAPTFSGIIPAQNLTRGQAMTPIDLDDYFAPDADTYAIVSGALPAGIALAGSVISGTPTETAAGVPLVFSGTNAQGSNNTNSVNFAVAGVPPVFSGPIPAQPWQIGQAITPIDLDDYFTPDAASYALISGTLPAGVALSGSVISGTPTAVSSGSLRFEGSNVDGADQTNIFTFSVADTSAPVFSGFLGPLPLKQTRAVTPVDVAAGFSVAADSFAVVAGALPAGLSLDPNTGLISGTPTTLSSGTFTVRGTNAFGTDDTNAVDWSVVELVPSVGGGGLRGASTGGEPTHIGGMGAEQRRRGYTGRNKGTKLPGKKIRA